MSSPDYAFYLHFQKENQFFELSYFKFYPNFSTGDLYWTGNFANGIMYKRCAPLYFLLSFFKTYFLNRIDKHVLFLVLSLMYCYIRSCSLIPLFICSNFVSNVVCFFHGLILSTMMHTSHVRIRTFLRCRNFMRNYLWAMLGYVSQQRGKT